MNQVEFNKHHLRVDVEHADADKGHDYDCSVFIGNLPWVINEEDVRKHFEDAGNILNIRIIRDKDTQIGKGIGYI